jgi:hypothetical protein
MAEIAAGAELSEPVACTLSGTDRKTQRERWTDLGATFGIRREPTDEGLRLSFRDDPAAERELRALVDVENDCCRWASWAVERDGGVLVMAARSAGDGVATLHAMFTETIPPGNAAELGGAGSAR